MAQNGCQAALRQLLRQAQKSPENGAVGDRHATTADSEERTAAERRAAMTWAQRLKRVFGDEDNHVIEDPVVSEEILAHPDAKVAEPEATRRPPCRAPPQRVLFDQTE